MNVYRLSDLSPDERRKLCRRNFPADDSLNQLVGSVFEAVAERGDAAVADFTRQFDSVSLDEIEATSAEFRQAAQRVTPSELQALQRAATNIETFHRAQKNSHPAVTVEPGVVCWREDRAIQRVGLYVPGGSAVLPSTVLMWLFRLAWRVRGGSDFHPASPGWKLGAPTSGGRRVSWNFPCFQDWRCPSDCRPEPGYPTCSPSRQIFGPGNRICSAAKLWAQFQGTAIDLVAGPSEVMVLADRDARPLWIATDLIAQAEHGPDSQTVLATPSRLLIEEVNRQLEAQLNDLPRCQFARQSLATGFALLVETLEQGVDFANQYAPEHLLIHSRRAADLAARVKSAGSIFLGEWSTEVAGDYASGSNHTLPTSGQARSISGVSLGSFLKQITFQRLSRAGLESLSESLVTLARLEGLEGHARSVRCRISIPAPARGDSSGRPS